MKIFRVSPVQWVVLDNIVSIEIHKNTRDSFPVVLIMSAYGSVLKIDTEDPVALVEKIEDAINENNKPTTAIHHWVKQFNSTDQPAYQAAMTTRNDLEQRAFEEWVGHADRGLVSWRWSNGSQVYFNGNNTNEVICRTHDGIDHTVPVPVNKTTEQKLLQAARFLYQLIFAENKQS